jgi:hypothetical protein
MGGYKISEAARATGFTESALRFYEREGVVVPERTETGTVLTGTTMWSRFGSWRGRSGSV